MNRLPVRLAVGNCANPQPPVVTSRGKKRTGQADTSLGRSFAYLPIAAGGTAFPYHIDVGTTRVRNLRLSDTLRANWLSA